MGVYFDTYNFNLAVIWILSAVFYIALYYGWLKKFLDWIEKLDVIKSRPADE